MNAVNRIGLAGFLSAFASAVFALEMDSNIDVSLASSTFKDSATLDWQPLTSFSPKLNLWLYPNKNTELSVRYGVGVVSAKSAGFLDQMSTAASSQGDFLLGDSNATVWENDDQTVVVQHQLEQLLATVWLNDASLNIGRQAISLGVAKVFSPADVIAPSSVDFSFSGYRFGVDALRMTWYAGPTSEIDGGIIKGSDQAVFARYKTSAYSLGFDVTGIQINGELGVLSVGVLGGIGSVGLWQESALYFEEGHQALRSTVGVDTTLLDDLYLMAEYHFNGLGKPPGAYFERIMSPFYQLGAVQPAGRHYLSVTATKPLNALLTGQANWVANLEDSSGNSLVGLAMSLTDNASATLNVSLPYGRVSNGNDSEYGVYPTGLNAGLNWVF